jgi:hypothetical protein
MDVCSKYTVYIHIFTSYIHIHTIYIHTFTAQGHYGHDNGTFQIFLCAWVEKRLRGIAHTATSMAIITSSSTYPQRTRALMHEHKERRSHLDRKLLYTLHRKLLCVCACVCVYVRSCVCVCTYTIREKQTGGPTAKAPRPECSPRASLAAAHA